MDQQTKDALIEFAEAFTKYDREATTKRKVRLGYSDNVIELDENLQDQPYANAVHKLYQTATDSVVRDIIDRTDPFKQAKLLGIPETDLSPEQLDQITIAVDKANRELVELGRKLLMERKDGSSTSKEA